jgi:[ribosomal protein S18]-alanine N-acetyltransferase
MSAVVTIREMTPADVPAIVAIERTSYSVPWSEATFRGLLRRRDAELVVALRRDAIIGFAVLWSVLDQAELGNVAVTAEARGCGVGERLVREMIQRAAGRGVREVFLEVRPSNHVARRLYQRLGFEHVGQRRNYYQEPVEDALVLRRPVRLDNELETDG